MELLTEKYIDEFLSVQKDVRAVLQRIIDEEKRSNIQLLDWSEEEIGNYLRSFDSESEGSLNRQFSMLRQFANYICERENIYKRKFVLKNSKLGDYVNREKLDNTTITFLQYKHIRSQLKNNVRDKLIFELAWHGLINKDIKMLKTTDITFKKSDFGWDIAFLDIGKEIPIKIEDPEVVEDIKNCINESNYEIDSIDDRTKNMQYKDSPYLIKPVDVGRPKTKETSAHSCNPSSSLKNALRAHEVECEGIDVERLTINKIQRSGLIYLLAPENEKDFSLEMIAILYGYKNETGLYWLRKVAREKYGEL